MHRPVVALLAVALLMSACDSNPAAPETAALEPSLARDGTPDHEHFRVPFAQTVVNSCPLVPDPVAVEGFLVYNSHFKFFEGGNQNRLKSTIHGTGVGAVTGAKYQFHQLYTIYGHYTYANSRLEADHHSRLHLISQNSLDNFFLTVRLKQVCTPDGCTVEVVSMETDCRG